MPRSSLKRSAQPDDWQRLVAELAPEVVEAVNPADWQALEHEVIVWLRRRISQFPWINTLALYVAVYSHTGAVAAYTKLVSLHGFLCWAIPDHYPDIARLNSITFLRDFGCVIALIVRSEEKLCESVIMILCDFSLSKIGLSLIQSQD